MAGLLNRRLGVRRVANFGRSGGAARPYWAVEQDWSAGEALQISGALDLLILGVGDLLDKIDHGSPQLCVRDLHEGFGEVEPV
jgi:hypothetical protein